MKRTLIFLLLAGWNLAVAQAPPAEEAITEADTDAKPDPCEIQGEPGLEEDEDDVTVPDSEPCEEQTPGEPPESEAADAAAAEIELMEPEDLEAEATEASVEEEFTPGDEISEDYPVPLPADI